MKKEMPRARFSMKELAAKSPVQTIIPECYTEIQNAEIIHETELAMRIKFQMIGKLDGKVYSYEEWFPKKYIIIKKNRYYCDDWILIKKVS